MWKRDDSASECIDGPILQAALYGTERAKQFSCGCTIQCKCRLSIPTEPGAPYETAQLDLSTASTVMQEGHLQHGVAILSGNRPDDFFLHSISPYVKSLAVRTLTHGFVVPASGDDLVYD